ncbi:MAG: hypothetical protein ABFS19_03835 [Thermodesulfobacteriota bacterium]
MDKQKKQSGQSISRRGSGFSLRIAIAAATLGMSMGVSPGEVLADSQQVAQKDQQVGVKNMKYDGVQKPGVTQAKPIPAAVRYKVKKPRAAYPKIERQRTTQPKGKVAPKAIQPETIQHKVKR